MANRRNHLKAEIRARVADALEDLAQPKETLLDPTFGCDLGKLAPDDSEIRQALIEVAREIRSTFTVEI